MSVHIDGPNGNITISGRLIGATDLPVKLWRGLVSQASTGAPTAVVLVNTLGGTIVWARSIAGQYTGTLVGAFPANKTFLLLTADLAGTVNSVDVRRVDDDTISFLTQVSGVDGDDVLLDASLEIAIYP